MTGQTGVPDVWVFDVAVSTHSLLQRGITAAQQRRVSVVAARYGEAALLACQLAAAVDGAMPTDLVCVEWPAR